MLETFQVLHIEEPDFGCEGRPDGFAIKDKVLLKSNLKDHPRKRCQTV